jgi:hypothetical protein
VKVTVGVAPEHSGGNATLGNCGDYRARRQPLARHFCHVARALPWLPRSLAGDHRVVSPSTRFGTCWTAAPSDDLGPAPQPHPLSIWRHHQRPDQEAPCLRQPRPPRVRSAVQASVRTPENSGTRTARRLANNGSLAQQPAGRIGEVCYLPARPVQRPFPRLALLRKRATSNAALAYYNRLRQAVHAKETARGVKAVYASASVPMPGAARVRKHPRGTRRREYSGTFAPPSKRAEAPRPSLARS